MGNTDYQISKKQTKKKNVGYLPVTRKRVALSSIPFGHNYVIPDGVREHSLMKKWVNRTAL